MEPSVSVPAGYSGSTPNRLARCFTSSQYRLTQASSFALGLCRASLADQNPQAMVSDMSTTTRNHFTRFGLLALGLLSCVFAFAGPLESKQLLGKWSGLKTFQDFNGQALSSKRTLTFLENGTYVSTNPDTKGRYVIEGNTVVLPNLYRLTFRKGILSDSRGILMHQPPQ